jgi:hypothetical protein
VKPIQTNPSKTKQKSLDLLGFIRLNRGFSMGYEQKNKKKSSRVSSCVQNVSNRIFMAPSAARLDEARVRSVNQKQR